MPRNAAAAKDNMTEKALAALSRTEGQYAGAVIRAEHRFRDAQRENKQLKNRLDEVLDESRKKLREWGNERAMRVAGAAAGGFGLGAAVAYFGDAFVVAKIGTGSLGLILIPGVGLIVAAVAPTIKDKGGKSAAETRAGVFGFGLGLMLMGGYMSYQRWK